MNQRKSFTKSNAPQPPREKLRSNTKIKNPDPKKYQISLKKTQNQQGTIPYFHQKFLKETNIWRNLSQKSRQINIHFNI